MSDVVACSQERYYLTKQLWGGSRVLAYHVAQSLRPRVPIHTSAVGNQKCNYPVSPLARLPTCHYQSKKSPVTFIGTIDIMHQIGSLMHHPDLDCIRYLHPCP